MVVRVAGIGQNDSLGVRSIDFSAAEGQRILDAGLTWTDIEVGMHDGKVRFLRLDCMKNMNVRPFNFSLPSDMLTDVPEISMPDTILFASGSGHVETSLHRTERCESP